MKSKIRIRKWRYLSIAIVIMLLSGCTQHYTSASSSDSYGLFSGIWHGIIFPFSLLGHFIYWVIYLILWVISLFLSLLSLIGVPTDDFNDVEKILFLDSIFGDDLMDNIQFIGRPNTGFFFYYIGYFLGISVWLGATE
jgi:hypothetical protein